MKTYHILTINPGSTSTKIGVFKNEDCLFELNVSHSPKQLEKYNNIWDQYTFRKQEILTALKVKDFSLSKLDAVVGRGGLVKPIPSGTYIVDQEMIEDARIGLQGQHASNLGCVIAYSIGWEYDLPSFIVDPPAVDDFEPLAKISGNKNFERSSLLHALNIFATGRKYAKSVNKKIEDLNLIIAHLGGGITVAALKKGKAINVNHGLYEGPFSPERSGSLPLFKMMEKCLSGKYTETELKKMVVGKGGLVSYFNTNNARDVEKLVVAGSDKYRLVFEAMGYQIAEEIGKRATNLHGKVDGIILTGGIAHSKILTSWIKDRVDFISDVHIFAGEAELESLAEGALRVLRGEERAKQYTQKIKKVSVLYWDNIDVYVKSLNIIEEKLKHAGYTFRKERDNNMHITYINCKSDEENVIKAVQKFKSDKPDVVFAIGSPISVRLEQYFKNIDIPVIYTGIYSTAIIPNFDNDSNSNMYATCYAPPINEQIENTLNKIEKNLSKIGIIYRRGELQAEIQYDNFKEYCDSKKIKLIGYEVQGVEDLEKANKYFKQNGVKWIYVGSNTVISGMHTDDLKVITENFPTICMFENTISKGGMLGYVVPWNEVSSKAVDIALDIFADVKTKTRVYNSDNKGVVANKKTVEKLKMKETIEKIGEIRYL